MQQDRNNCHVGQTVEIQRDSLKHGPAAGDGSEGLFQKLGPPVQDSQPPQRRYMALPVEDLDLIQGQRRCHGLFARRSTVLVSETKPLCRNASGTSVAKVSRDSISKVSFRVSTRWLIAQKNASS